MVLVGTEILITTVIASFVLLALFHQHEEGWFGRAALVSIILGIGTFLLTYGVIGYVLAVIISFAALMGMQKYSFLSALLFLICAELVSQVISIGIQKYF